MVQEAKASCRGKWYLPAGRMERNESIVVGEIYRGDGEIFGAR